MAAETQKDLVLLTADKDMEFALKGILSRPDALRITTVHYDSFVHPEHDPGCFLRGHDFLRTFIGQYKHALVLLDRDGCGQEQKEREELELELEERLALSGWDGNASAIVIQPELEIWFWSDSPEVDRVLGWNCKNPCLRDWLSGNQLWEYGATKPGDPKKAVELALRHVRKPKSASIYEDLASKVSFKRCEDPAFDKLCRKLREWFST